MSIDLYKLIKIHLSYRSVYFRQGVFKKTREEFDKSTFISHNKEGYFFYTGFIPKIRTYCLKNKIDLIEKDVETYGLVYKEPTNIPAGVDARSFQMSMVKKVIDLERGILKAPTGTGKTILGLYVISCLEGLGNVLWLCHTKDLMHQTADEAEKWFGKKSIGRVGDGFLELGKFFTSATRQTFKEHAEEWGTEYDMVVCDECFAKNTLVKTPTKEIPIQSLTIGDSVYTENGINLITKIFKTKVPLSHVIKLTLSNGKEIFCSKDHLFKINNEWTKAIESERKELTPFNNLFKRRKYENKTFDRIRVESIEIYEQNNNDKSFLGVIGDKERNQGFVEFYDLEVKNDHSYYVENVLVHNCHHLSAFPEVDKHGKELGEYGHIFKRIFAPIRIGLTATMPDSAQAKMAIEALIGPMLEEFSIEEAREQGYMAKPIIRIKKIPVSERVKQLKKYSDVYEWGIVRRLERNNIILDIVEEHQKKNETCLIVVTKLDHGRLIKKLADSRKIPVEFISGSSDTESRTIAKRMLNNKDIKCVICTAVWKEGTNIPELNVVINAAGGKSELNTLQVVGRGLRKTDTKSELIIYDFFDPSHNYLIGHFGNRFSLYCDNGWV